MKREPYKLLDLFSGIGGFSLGLERTGGFETVAFCEINKFSREVLAKNWPEVPIYDDVRTINAETLARDGITVDVITGGFPCQDLSIAGKRAGLDGARSGLWSEIVRLIRELRPKFLIVENVANLLDGPSNRPGRWFGRVLGDLAECRYDAEWSIIRGIDVGVPQSRPRVFLVAYPSQSCFKPLLRQNPVNVARSNSWIHEPSGEYADIDNQNSGARTVSILGNAVRAAIPHRERSGSNERLSSGVDRYKAIGNTVIPQIPELIGRAILAAETEAA